ncbi:MAG: prepilin-type N-terminal cleavage/methylation domain-containing protein, partial [Janthinobacterium lividum]
HGRPQPIGVSPASIAAPPISDTRCPGPASNAGDAGFTLLEVIIALVLFALVSVAGVALVDTVLDVQRRTDGRLERLGDLQRAMFIVTRDFTELADAPLAGGATGVGFDRHGGGGVIGVSYRFDGGVLQRVQSGRTQRVIDHVGAVAWRYYALPGGWQDRWPANDDQARGWPLAVELDVTLAAGPGLSGTLRRVVALPVRPLAPGVVAP